MTHKGQNGRMEPYTNDYSVEVEKLVKKYRDNVFPFEKFLENIDKTKQTIKKYLSQ